MPMIPPTRRAIAVKAGSYLDIVLWPGVQHGCKVALVMNGDEQPTRKQKHAHKEKPGSQYGNKANTLSTGSNCIADFCPQPHGRWILSQCSGGSWCLSQLLLSVESGVRWLKGMPTCSHLL